MTITATVICKIYIIILEDVTVQGFNKIKLKNVISFVE